MHREIDELIPWGIRRSIIETVLQLVLDAVREDGMVVIGSILDGKFKLVQVDTADVQNLDNGRRS
jgi:hypothetical protein